MLLKDDALARQDYDLAGSMLNILCKIQTSKEGEEDMRKWNVLEESINFIRSVKEGVKDINLYKIYGNIACSIFKNDKIKFQTFVNTGGLSEFLQVIKDNNISPRYPISEQLHIIRLFFEDNQVVNQAAQDGFKDDLISLTSRTDEYVDVEIKEISQYCIKRIEGLQPVISLDASLQQGQDSKQDEDEISPEQIISKRLTDQERKEQDRQEREQRDKDKQQKLINEKEAAEKKKKEIEQRIIVEQIARKKNIGVICTYWVNLI
ncbi:MAG: hypothetical protein EZS28_042970 [Streblomastix strix]|uniref:Uncharacterized protein n=1 Tax=Streblomastix strix TaxID=222440 RepID=A0A5J4TUC0_9EUKA|nr:MAG: hypothetical protein EZS28_042970 [Streblomastix strix]